MQNYLTNILRRVNSVSRNYLPSRSKDNKHVLIPGTDPLSRLIWVDLELTGLDPETDTILEAACVITEANLDIVAEGPNIVIHHPACVIDQMGPWCQEQHRKTGLIDAVMKSSITLEMAEEQLLEFVRKFSEPGKCAIAGNTVYMDRIFIKKCLPKFEQHLHYRIVDVSTVKELCRRWNRDIFVEAPTKTFSHRALEDILESITELKYYKHRIFDQKSGGNGK